MVFIAFAIYSVAFMRHFVVVSERTINIYNDIHKKKIYMILVQGRILEDILCYRARSYNNNNNHHHNKGARLLSYKIIHSTSIYGILISICMCCIYSD